MAHNIEIDINNQTQIDFELGSLYNDGRRIKAIKLYRLIYGVSLPEAKHQVERQAACQRGER